MSVERNSSEKGLDPSIIHENFEHIKIKKHLLERNHRIGEIFIYLNRSLNKKRNPKRISKVCEVFVCFTSRLNYAESSIF